MPGSIDELKQSNDEADAAPAQVSAPQAAPAGSPIDQLKQSNDQAEAQSSPVGSMLENALNSTVEWGKSVGRGAKEAAPFIANEVTPAFGLPKFFEQNKEKETALAESIASGVTLGASRIVENKIMDNQADQARRVQQSQDLTTFGNAFGNAGMLAMTGGSGALLEKAGISGLKKVALGSAIDATGLAAGNVVSDQALGDPDLNAQKLASALWDAKGDLALSAIFGAGTGLAIHGTISGLKKFGPLKGSIPEAIQANQAEPTAVPTPPPDAPITRINPEAPQFAKYQEAVKATDLSEIEKQLADAKAMGLTTDLPQKQALIDAQSRLPESQFPLNRLQLDSMNNQAADVNYQTMKQLKTEDGGKIGDIEAFQKQEALSHTDLNIKNIAPDYEATPDLQEAGDRIKKTFSDNYKATKEAEIPLMNALKNYELPNQDHVPGVINQMSNRVPGISQMFDADTGAIREYNPGWGIGKDTYNTVKSTIDGMRELPDVGIKELANLRDSMELNLDPQSKAGSQIRQLKAGMMDYIQGQLEKVEPNVPAEANVLRDSMKRYAINEQNREIIGRVFGAPIDSPNFMDNIRNPSERVLDKVFSSTESVKAARQLLGQKQFNNVLADYLTAARDKVTREGVFSSNKFKSFLDKKNYPLSEAMSDPKNAVTLQKIKDWNTKMRYFADAKPQNVSGNIGEIHKLTKVAEDIANGDFGSVAKYAKEHFFGKMKEQSQKKAINDALQGKGEVLNKVRAVDKMNKTVDDKVTSGVRAILLSSEQFDQKKRRPQ